MTDCFLSQHSGSGQWTSTNATSSQVVSLLRQAVDESPKSDNEANMESEVPRLRWMTKGERVTFVGKNGEDASVDGDGRATVQFLRVSGKVKFRDLTTFVVSDKQDGTTLVQGDGRSLDYHVWTVCPCCFGGLCRYVACFFCCCGVCPTKDWGQNEQTLSEIITSVSSSNIEFIPVGSGSVGSTSNPSATTTTPPDVVDVER
jgi:hypothetical protein